MTAARASVSACLMRGSVSFSSAASSAGSALCSRDLNTACADSKRLSGSAACRLKPPTAASSARRTRLLTRTSLRSAGSAPAAGSPVAASISLPGLVLVEDLLLLGAVGQPAVLQRLDDGDGPRIAGRRDLGNPGVGLAEIVLEEMRQRGGKAGQSRSRRGLASVSRPGGFGGRRRLRRNRRGRRGQRDRQSEKQRDQTIWQDTHRRVFPAAYWGGGGESAASRLRQNASSGWRRRQTPPPHLLVLML